MDVVLEAIELKVTESMNQALLRDFTREEIDLALKHMEPLKAPGPDGMLPIFFQSFWSMIGPMLFLIALIIVIFHMI